MPKALCITGLVIAGLVLLLFLSDLLLGLIPGLDWMAPFRGASILTDLVFVAGAAALGYLSWTTFKEQV